MSVAVLVAACAGPRAQGGRAPATAAAPTPPVDRPPAESVHVEPLAAGLNDVGYDLFRVAAQDSDTDVVLSPLSIGIAFGMADVGATGSTAEVLADLFAYPVQGEDRLAAFNALEQGVADVGAPEVRLANRMFPDTGFSVTEGYDATLARWFGAGLEPLPLRAESEASRRRINAWVKEQTKDLIPELLKQGFVNGQSVLVLVNALYLKADWALQFGKYPTEAAPFRRLDGSSVTVPLMHELELSGPAVDAKGYTAIEIPYEDNKLSMLVIVPDAGQYGAVERRFGSDLVAEIDAAARPAPVELWLPRFESTSTLDLRPMIEGDLNVTGLFGSAGWDGIGPGITLESAVHGADISVDEFGTVAAAATALGFEESGPPQPKVTVRADKPFLYVIRHTGTGAVLFVGRVLDPSK